MARHRRCGTAARCEKNARHGADGAGGAERLYFMRGEQNPLCGFAHCFAGVEIHYINREAAIGEKLYYHRLFKSGFDNLFGKTAVGFPALFKDVNVHRNFIATRAVFPTAKKFVVVKIEDVVRQDFAQFIHRVIIEQEYTARLGEKIDFLKTFANVRKALKVVYHVKSGNGYINRAVKVESSYILLYKANVIPGGFIQSDRKAVFGTVNADNVKARLGEAFR
jgi:hypothetical protein